MGLEREKALCLEETSRSSAEPAKQLTNRTEPTPKTPINQILMRSLAVEARIEAKDLERLDRIETVGATLRLVESTTAGVNQQPDKLTGE